ncbi:glycosyltransferase [Butyrivibrio sp. XB500-5]|uniref:glycosyltransferase family 4 protein n=1 Tax=Butyrivibrio sp. XB500-5 TaxID=2364880 RepID=UPI000EA90A3C|nr:glycosyltransferase family 4 protein [Butyrivibrio sp. XB500-5]RKM59669.1 glycosyltransferase [Butyrivibrio sp. XB500-5]
MRVLWLCNIMLPAYAEAHGVEYSVREGWLTGCLDRIIGENDSEKKNLTLGICFPKEDAGNYKEVIDGITYYDFTEDLDHPETYDRSIEERFRTVLDDFNPDIVHIFGTEFPHTLAMLRAFNNPDKTLLGIQGLCGAIAFDYMAGLPANVQESATFRDRIKDDSLVQQRNKFLIRAEHEKEAILSVGNITGRTDFDKAETAKINPEAKYFSMNETMRPLFYTGKWEEKKADPHTIFLAQGDYPLKGFHFVLQAMPKILEKYPDAHLYVAGNNIIGKSNNKYPFFLRASAYGKYLRKLISSNKLKKKVSMLGTLNQEQMKDRFLHSSVFVCASVIENSPNSVGEAMLLGVPIVASRTGGIPNLLTDKKDGLLFENKNPEELADKILEIWDEPVISAVYGDNASKHARVTHDADANYKRLIEIYDEINGKE